MLEQCELKHGQLFFLIKVYEICLRLSQFLLENSFHQECRNIQHDADSLAELKKLYQESERKLDTTSFGHDFNQQRIMLVLLQEKMQQGFLAVNSLKDLIWQDAFHDENNEELKKIKKKLLKLLNFIFDLKSINQRSLLDAQLELFLKRLNKMLSIFLELILGADYSEIFRLEEECFLLNKWQKDLLEFKNKVLVQSTNIYIHQILVNNKLTAGKKEFSQFFYAEANKYSSVIENELLLSFDVKQDKKITDYIRLKNQTIKQTVHAIEYSLQVERYDVLCLAKLISLWKCTSFYSISEHWIGFVEESTKAGLMQNIPIMNTELWPSSIIFFTYSMSILVISLDLYLSQFMGVSNVLISSITELILLEAVNYQDFFDSIGDHRRAMYTEVFPSLKLLLNIAVYLLIQCLVVGFSKENMMMALGAYCVGVLFQKTTNYLLLKFFNRCHSNSQAYQFFNIISSYLSFGLGTQFWYVAARIVKSSMGMNLNQYSKNIIFNQQFCQNQPELCCEQAKTILTKHELDMSQTVDKLELKAKLRHFLLGHHPDKTIDSDRHTIYHEVSVARQIVKFQCSK